MGQYANAPKTNSNPTMGNLLYGTPNPGPAPTGKQPATKQPAPVTKPSFTVGGASTPSTPTGQPASGVLTDMEHRPTAGAAPLPGSQQGMAIAPNIATGARRATSAFDFGGNMTPSGAQVAPGAGGSPAPGGTGAQTGQYGVPAGGGGGGFSYGGSAGDSGTDWRAKSQQAGLDFLKPLQEKRQAALETQLSNMGLTRGSEAWSNEMQRLSDQDLRDNLGVFDSGRQETSLAGNLQNQNFNQILSASGQNFDQLLRSNQYNDQTRTQSLNELNALLNGQQVNSPQMPGFSQAGVSQGANYTQAAQNQYSGAMDQYNAKASQQAGLINAGIGIAGLFSDMRLKKDITQIGTLPNGIKIYKYRFNGGSGLEMGVLAQEVAEIMPDAVHMDPTGYLKVNYDMVLK
jgi:hypothetical protein